MRYLNVFSIACLPVALSLAACSAKEDPPGCFSFDYANYMATTSPTLEANVMQVFMTCATNITCHGNGAHPPNLGGTAIGGVPVSAATVKASLINVTSTEVAAMKYVVPGFPKDSYLMRKVESPNPGCDLACVPPVGVPNGCSTRMPSGEMPPLGAAQITTIRDWIKSGAN